MVLPAMLWAVSQVWDSPRAAARVRGVPRRGTARDRKRIGTGGQGRTGRRNVHWYQNIVELIDMRSFSNLWFWIVLAVVWSINSHWVLGVPMDMILRARRKGGAAQQDLEALLQINVRRMIHIGDVAGMWATGLVAFMLTMLAMLGFAYGIEFCQAVFLLAMPMSVVSFINQRLAQRLEAAPLGGADLRRLLLRHRLHKQLIGVAAILFTAMWGMWKNMNTSALGG